MLATVAFVGLAAFAGTPSALADGDRDCQRRIAKADHKVHEAVEHHGMEQQQAEHARHETATTRGNAAGTNGTAGGRRRPPLAFRSRLG